VTTRGAFHRQGPFVGSGGHYSPGPATTAPPFSERDNRWMTFSRHPGSPPVLCRSLRRSPTHQSSFRASRSLTLSCQSPRRLGPRSLSPPLFLERCVRAYSGPGCCLPTSATAYDVRTNNPGLSFPRWDGGHDHLPFLTPHARPTRVTPSSGETRRAAHSSVRSDPGAGSSWLPRFARPRYRTDRDTFRRFTLTFVRLRAESSVPIDVHGSLDRVKDASSFPCHAARGRDECARLAYADDVPLLILPEDTCCRRCDRLHGNEPRTPASDRPRPAFHRLPAKATGILWTRVPSTVATAGP